MSIIDLSEQLTSHEELAALACHQYLTKMLHTYIQDLDGDDVVGFAFSANVGPGLQDFSFAVAIPETDTYQDVLSFEFSQIPSGQLEGVELSKVIELLDDSEAHRFIRSMLSTLHDCGQFYDLRNEDGILNFVWKSRNGESISLVVFDASSREYDVIRTNNRTSDPFDQIPI